MQIMSLLTVSPVFEVKISQTAVSLEGNMKKITDLKLVVTRSLLVKVPK